MMQLGSIVQAVPAIIPGLCKDHWREHTDSATAMAITIGSLD